MWNLIFDWDFFFFFPSRQDGSLTNCGTESHVVNDLNRRVQKVNVTVVRTRSCCAYFHRKYFKITTNKILTKKQDEWSNELLCFTMTCFRNFSSPLNSAWTNSSFTLALTLQLTTKNMVWCYWCRHIILVVSNLFIFFKQKKKRLRTLNKISKIGSALAAVVGERLRVRTPTLPAWSFKVW